MARRGLFTLLKTGLLSLLVVLSFVYSSLGWRHYVTEESTRIIVGAAILLSVYVLMMLELVNRNLAALIGAAVSVAAYDCLVEYVEMEDILQWEDLETLALLFGMMIIVNVLGSSGLFNFLAIWSYKKSNGRFWLLIVIMSFITAFLSAFIDNVSTMLLMSPTLIKLSELEHIDPRFVLMIMTIFSNIGGCATPVGDPPNLIIIGSELVGSLGITFGSFTAYCAPCVLMSIAIVLLYFKLRYKSKESFRLPGHQHHSVTNRLAASNQAGDMELLPPAARKQLEVLQEFKRRLASMSSSASAADSSSSKSCEADRERTRTLVRQIEDQIAHLSQSHHQQLQPTNGSHRQLVGELAKSKSGSLTLSVDLEGSAARSERLGSRLDEREVKQLMGQFAIKSQVVLWQSVAVLAAAVVLFFIQSMPNSHLTLGWVSLFAALTLLVMSSGVDLPPSGHSSGGDDDDDEDEDGEENSQNPQKQHGDGFERVVQGIEWSTLMFFFALFIIMEVMTKLGLIKFVGSQITHLVELLPEGNLRSVGAITIILWASGLASALIDNVPFTSMMIKVLASMVVHNEAHMPPASASLSVKPLVFALAFGACFGGNGTLIGASANLVTAGLAGRAGYPMSFNHFLRFAAPATLISLLVANLYLVVVFVLLGL